MKKICVIGIGYIGLPTAAMFAQSGYDVVGVDINENVVNQLNKGHITIEEPELGELVSAMVNLGSLKASTNPCESDYFIIAVPTPIDSNKKADLNYVISACNKIVPYLKKGNVVILESTSPVGTTEDIIKPILEKSGLVVGVDLCLGYCPERVIPGKILKELINNSRIIGGINEVSAEKIKYLYESFVAGEIYLTDSKTAEMCKLMENTYRDVNIALANELTKICESVDINVWDVIKYCNKHPRVNIHNPGPGVGGHCLAIDPWFLVDKFPDLAKIIELSRTTNDSMPYFVFNKIESIINEEKCKKVITILGITYKANIDDIRESPIIKIIDLLEKNGYTVKVNDPFVKNDNKIYNNLLDACKDSSILVLAVDHDDFKKLPIEDIKQVMGYNIILDLRNFLDEETILSNGFKYALLGKNK